MSIKKNFNQHRNAASTNWFFLVAVILFLLCLRIQEAHCAERDIQETLYARIKINVTWNIVWGKSVNKGSLAVNVNGMLNYNKEMSAPTHGLPVLMLTYDPQNMTWSYRYKEEHINQGNTKCPLSEEYHGSGSFSLRQPAKLMVHYLGSLAKVMPLKRTGDLETDDHLTDYYVFSLQQPALTAEGKRRDFISECSYKPSKRPIHCTLGLNKIRMKANGEMSGHRTWTSHFSSGRPNFTIRISDVGKRSREKPYSPPKEVPGNVTYSVEWRIDKAPAIEIFRETEPDVFVPIANASQEVIVGERVKLKAVIYPEDKDPKQGEWSIGSITPKSKGDYKEKKFLKDFVVSGEKGEVVELMGEELKRPEIKFHWWDEVKNIKVKYKTTVDGKEVTGESTFNVRKPVITMNAETPQGEPYCGPIVGGPDNVFYETPEQTTIKFTRTEIPEDFPGETQYVQVVREVGCMLKGQTALPFTTIRNKIEIRSFCGEIDHTGLDKDYPYTKEREALDTPGFDFGTRDQEISVRREFKMFLEYRPKKEGAIFVPLRVTDWEWKGVAKWDSPQAETPSCHMTRTENPRDKPANEYATWTKVLNPTEDRDGRMTDKWDPCIPEKTECQ